MLDAVDTNSESKADRLDTVLLTATNLCQQLSLLQKMQSQENSLFTQYGEILANQAKEIEQSLKSLKEDISNSIKNSTNMAFSGIENHLDNSLSNLFAAKLNPLIEMQSRVISETKAIIEKVQKDRYGWFLWKFIGTAIVIATLVGSCVGLLVSNQVL